MSNVQQFFGSSGSTGILQQFAVNQSWNFVAKTKGKYLVTAIGGGARGVYTTAGQGGGAGGLAQSLLQLDVNDTLVIVSGAGGTVNSVNGGTTTVTKNGITILTANGGSGIAGGQASGGNVMNVAGGNGSNTGGGGAVGVYGVICNQIGQYGAGTGGGTLQSNYYLALPMSTTGGHTHAFSGNWTVYDPTVGCLPFQGNRILAPTGLGDTATNGAGRGGGAGYSGFNGGMFAGGGLSTAQGYLGGQGGIFGGGGGGAAVYEYSSGYPGNGGDGGVIIEWIAYTL